MAKVLPGAEPSSGRSGEILPVLPSRHEWAVGCRSSWGLLVVARVTLE